MKSNILKGKGLVLLVMLIIFFSCDKIDKSDYIKPVGTVENKGRKILLEEFTGHRCTNCPAATAIANTLAKTYNPNIILISIHSGDLSKPTAIGSFQTDYRTEEGNTIYNEFGLTATPNGIVSRAEYAGKMILTSGDWAGAVNALMEDEPLLNINIDAKYSTDKRKITADINLEFNNDLQEDLNIVYAITENELVSPQKFPDMDSMNYAHQHVLRQMPEGAWGTPVLSASDNVKKGDNKSFSKEIELNEQIVPQNVELVVFVSNRETREVLQVEKISIKELINVNN